MRTAPENEDAEAGRGDICTEKENKRHHGAGGALTFVAEGGEHEERSTLLPRRSHATVVVRRRMYSVHRQSLYDGECTFRVMLS